jgi:hypothetical protein
VRDPDLIGRAQRAATQLERAWDRWRAMHGISQEPMPAVSSYVGYSLEEPWGEPRVVFGIEAGEAEQFAALLDRHDCAGPVYAGLASRPGTRSESGQELITATELGRVVVPSQAQPTVAEREAAWREATWREAMPREQEPAPPPQPQPHGSPPEPAAQLTAQVTTRVPAAQGPAAEAPAPATLRVPGTAEDDEAIPPGASVPGGAEPDRAEPDRAAPGVAAFRPEADPASGAGRDEEEDVDPSPLADQADEPAQPAPRTGRGRAHALSRPRRGAKPGAAK